MAVIVQSDQADEQQDRHDQGAMADTVCVACPKQQTAPVAPAVDTLQPVEHAGDNSPYSDDCKYEQDGE